MANNFKKIAFFSALAGVAAAGTYYFLQKKNEIPELDVDDIDDFDDFDDDFDEEFESNPKPKKRSYVSLDFNNAKEIVGENVIKAIDKTKELITDYVPETLDKAKELVEEFTFPQETASETSDEKEFTELTESDEETAADDAESEDFEFSEEE